MAQRPHECIYHNTQYASIKEAFKAFTTDYPTVHVSIQAFYTWYHDGIILVPPKYQHAIYTQPLDPSPTVQDLTTEPGITIWDDHDKQQKKYPFKFNTTLYELVVPFYSKEDLQIALQALSVNPTSYFIRAETYVKQDVVNHKHPDPVARECD
jgi:hypothetical protein